MAENVVAQCHPLRSSTSTHFFQPLECVRVSVGAGLPAIYPKVGSIPASRTKFKYATLRGGVFVHGDVERLVLSPEEAS